MKKLELYPNKENILNTFLNDRIGRNNDLCYFISLLDSIEGAFSIALDGNWGSGKTFFVKQAEMILSARNEFYKRGEFSDCKEQIMNTYLTYNSRIGMDESKETIVPIYYDSWKYDNENDPVLSIVYEIISTLDNEYDFEKEFDEGKAFGEIVKAFTKIDITALKTIDDFKEIKSSRNIKDRIDSFLSNILAERGDKLVVFIDEIDRCKPTYAIKLMERIKHYFEHENIIFVFSTNLEELQHSVKAIYGSDFSAFRYLDRFFDLKIPMPKLEYDRYYDYILGGKSEAFFDIICKSIIENYHFELRDQVRFLQTLKSTSFNIAKNKDLYNEYSLCLHFLSPIMIALYIYDYDTYKSFIDGENIKPLEDLVQNPRLFKMFFKYYCNINVSYEEVEKGEFEVEIEGQKKTSKDFLNEIYKAIFPINKKIYGYLNIGFLVINNDMKTYLLEINNAISRNAYENRLQLEKSGG